jgi:uncharacterized protein with FMN-binding domain
MGKTNLSLLAIALIVLGSAVTAGHPALGTITGIALLLLGVGIGAGALSFRSDAEDCFPERKAQGQKVSNTLVALSSAAIIAVYAAGYHRTGSAAKKYEEQTARRKTAAPMEAAIAAVTSQAAVTPPAATHPFTPPARKKSSLPSLSSARNTKSAIPRSAGTVAAPVAPLASTATSDPSAEADTTTAQPKYKNGTYLGWGTSRHGDIQASVVVQDGQITSAVIATCATRYPCSWIVNLPPQVVVRQSPKVDYVSGATQSSDAFSDAVADALSKAIE